MSWRPIATAPKDGTAVIVCGATWGGYEAFYKDGEWWTMDQGTMTVTELITSPTHWMPLPEPPSPPPGDRV